MKFISDAFVAIKIIKERGAGPDKPSEGCPFSIDYAAELTLAFQLKLHQTTRAEPETAGKQITNLD